MPQFAPTVRLNSGYDLPVIGLGTWKGTGIPKTLSADGAQRRTGEVEQAVRDAIDAGYRHIDCALIYDNEEEIGDAIRSKIEEGVIKREDLFVTSKLWCTFHRPDLVEKACRGSLKKLGLDYLDLYLIHWPTAFQESEAYFPKDKEGNLDVLIMDLLDTWKAMEELVPKGLVKSIGVSNFNSVQLKKIVDGAKIVPAVHQIEVNPYFAQKKMRQLCKEFGITVAAYSPFGSPARPWADWEKEKNVLEEPVLKEIGAKYNKSIAQVALRYLVQIGTVPLPKSGNKQRLQNNFEIFDFELTPEELARIEALDFNQRTCPFEPGRSHPQYPFNIEF